MRALAATGCDALHPAAVKARADQVRAVPPEPSTTAREACELARGGDVTVGMPRAARVAVMAVVAVFSADEDTVLLRPHLRDAGYEPVGAYVREIRDGRVDVLAFLREHRPDAVVYDVEPPLKANWNFVRLIRNAAGVRNSRFILLTSDKRGLERTIGRGAVNELVFARPYDLAEILRAVRFVVEDRTTP